MANQNLKEAKAAKNDEFYTQLHDIEVEMQAYTQYDPDVFRGKTVLLPCDDPEWSNFTRYFAQKFGELGLRKLISTSYAADSKRGGAGDGYVATFFERDSPEYDERKTRSRGKIFVMESVTGGVGIPAYDDQERRQECLRPQLHAQSRRQESRSLRSKQCLRPQSPCPELPLQWRYLEGDGDFRSAEVTRLRDEADIIITNPPFSLFREFLAWITEGGKQFCVIGNKNAITYKEVFPLIKENKIWSGARQWAGGMWFETKNAGDYDRISDNGVKMKNVPSFWITNLDHGRRHEPMRLLSMGENLLLSRHKELRGKASYDSYDNYEAIEVPFTDAIPSDYDGVMGVPISFLDKYCPEQFEIVWTTDRGGDGMLEDIKLPHERYDAPVVNGKGMYKRILIRHRR